VDAGTLMEAHELYVGAVRRLRAPTTLIWTDVRGRPSAVAQPAARSQEARNGAWARHVRPGRATRIQEARRARRRPVPPDAAPAERRKEAERFAPTGRLLPTY
jgi:hypothetical protein